jgi:hypothetical protein
VSAVSSEGASAPGARLVELDRLLRDIQTELLPEREPAPLLAAASPPAAEPTAPPPADEPSAPLATPDPQLRTASELSAHLVASMRELLAGYERVLVGSAAPPSARRPPRRRPASPDVTVSAAPFRSLDALREFEQAVSRLPGVREVAIQGYEGADRAIIEVRLDPPR